MTCSFCGPIGDGATANTGRGEYFEAPITKLTRHDLGDRDDLRECPACGAFFRYDTYEAQTGSGNNDEDTLVRLDAPTTATLRELVHRKAPPAEDAGAKLFALPHLARDLAARAVQRDAELYAAMMPWMLGHSSDPWALTFVKDYASTPERAAHIRDLIAAHELTPSIEDLRRHVRVVGCTICRDVRPYPPTRDIPAELCRVNVAREHDVYECPSCGSLFERNADALKRLYEWQANEVRALVDRGRP